MELKRYTLLGTIRKTKRGYKQELLSHFYTDHTFYMHIKAVCVFGRQPGTPNYADVHSLRVRDVAVLKNGDTLVEDAV